MNYPLYALILLFCHNLFATDCHSLRQQYGEDWPESFKEFPCGDCEKAEGDLRLYEKDRQTEQLDDRLKDCEDKAKFNKSFAGECKDILNNIESEDGHTLIFGENSTPDQPGFEVWCNEKKALAREDQSLDIKALFKQDSFKILEDGDLSEDRKKEGFRWWVACSDGSYMQCENALKSAIVEAIETCGDSRKEAVECCHEPQSCVGGGLAQALDSLGKMNLAIASIQGQKKQCQATKQTFGLYSGMTGTMAAQCIRKAKACQNTCSDQMSQVVKAFKYACGVDPRKTREHDPDSVSCSQSFFNHYKEMITTDDHGLTDYAEINLSQASKACKQTGKESNRRIQDMTNNMGAALMASVRECEQKFPEHEWPKLPELPHWQPPPFGQPPTFSQLPKPPPRTGGGGDSKKTGSIPHESPLGPATNPFDIEPPTEEGGPDMGKGGPSGFGGLVGGGGSGGAPGLGGGGGGGGDGGGSGQGGAGDPKKRKILLGHKGGKFTGYSGGGGNNSRDSKELRRRAFSKKQTKRGISSLDLKKLFPKRQLNNKIGKFGSPHDDIFKRIRDRMQYMCKTNRLDCE